MYFIQDNSQLNTHFETIAILGQGAFGTVIKARRRDYNFPNIKQHYAIKMVNMKGRIYKK
jgi:serine/threonine protein kinase